MSTTIRVSLEDKERLAEFAKKISASIREIVNHLDAVAVMAYALEGKFGKACTADCVILEPTLLLKSS